MQANHTNQLFTVKYHNTQTSSKQAQNRYINRDPATCRKKELQVKLVTGILA